MDLELLPTFFAFAETLNFTHAAKRVHLSQPAVHMQVKKLESDLGVALYRRVGRGLELTREGVLLSRFAHETQTRTHAFLEELRGRPAEEPIVLAAGEGAFLYLLGPALRAYRGPLRLRTRDRDGTIEDLRSGVAELGVAAMDGAPEGLAHALLTTVEPMVVVPKNHRLAKKRRLTIRDLEGERMIVPPAGRPHRIAIADAFRRARIELEIAVEASGWEPMVHFVSLGLGLAIVNGCCRLSRGLGGKPIADIAPVDYRVMWPRSSRATKLRDTLLAHAESWREAGDVAWSRR
ncbi:MAG: LysR family transcriptional regulator [Polyangiales bacterium]